LADRHVTAVPRRDEEHLVEHDRRTLVARELLDHHGLARLDAILLTTRLDHGVHDNLRKRLSESGTLQIARHSSSGACHRGGAGRGFAQRPRRLCNRSEVMTGLARPWVSFMTWPTKNPNSPSLPPTVYASACLGLAATIRLMISHSTAGSEICCSPRRSMISAGASPVRKLSSNPSLPILPLIVPFSTSTTSAESAAGGIGERATGVPLACSAPSSSVSTQLASIRPLRSPGCAATTASKQSASARSLTSGR